MSRSASATADPPETTDSGAGRIGDAMHPFMGGLDRGGSGVADAGGALAGIGFSMSNGSSSAAIPPCLSKEGGDTCE